MSTKIYDKPCSRWIRARITPTIQRRILNEAKRRAINKSQLIRELIIKGLDREDQHQE